MTSHYERPNHALHLTAAGRRSCNRCVPVRRGSLSLGR
jgi:hypothetical protein